MRLARTAPCLISSLLLLAELAPTLAAKQPLVVVSVDGLDNRYLQNADRMGLGYRTCAA